ncbi:PAS factor family protein [Vibrio astriarenae]|uniref:PAS factor family protein n=1 Tax=Vibrio astriarenae TaxID=1481923 RepID=UPI003736A864
MPPINTLMYDTLKNLSDNEHHNHAQIRQTLYDQLDLTREQQLVLYSRVLGPASAGRYESSQALDDAVNTAIQLLEK